MDKKKINRSFVVLWLILVALIALLIAPAVSVARDGDGDGFDSKVECNDKDDSIYPGATEICGDGIDQDCDGADTPCGGGVVDTDEDGFPDSMEENGFPLPNGLALADSGLTSIASCLDSPAPCVDPNKPDFFIAIKGAGSGTLMPNNPLAILEKFTNSNGIPVVPHELTITSPNNYSRDFIDPADGTTVVQRAVVVTEYLDADAGPLGFAPTGGTPFSTSGQVSLFTNRIVNAVDKLCDQAYLCDRKEGCDFYTVNMCESASGVMVDLGAGQSLVPLYDLYTQNVLAHEAWHVGSLAPIDSLEAVLHHFDPNTGWVLEQAIGTQGVKARDGTVTITLFISEEFNTDSRAKYKLKE